MEIVAFSDIHAVIATWEAVYVAMQRQNPDGYWCLGDIIGRGFQPIAVAQALKILYSQQDEWHQASWVRGNHDQNIFDNEARLIDEKLSHSRMNPTDTYWDEYNRQLIHAGERDDLLDWLRELPVYGQNLVPDIFAGVHTVHGRFILKDGQINGDDSIWEPTREDADIKAQINHLHQYNGVLPRVVINGHTHHAMIALYDCTTDSITHVPHDELAQGDKFDLTANKTLVVNVGSVSFPRGQSPKYAMYATLNFIEAHHVFAKINRVCLPKGTLNIPTDYDSEYTGDLEQLCLCD